MTTTTKSHIFNGEQTARVYAAQHGMLARPITRNVEVAAIVLGLSSTTNLSRMLKEAGKLGHAVCAVSRGASARGRDVVFYRGCDSVLVNSYAEHHNAEIHNDISHYSGELLELKAPIPYIVPLCPAAVAALVLGQNIYHKLFMEELMPLMLPSDLVPYVLQTDYTAYKTTTEETLKYQSQELKEDRIRSQKAFNISMTSALPQFKPAAQALFNEMMLIKK